MNRKGICNKKRLPYHHQVTANLPLIDKKNREQVFSLHFGDIITKGVYYSLLKMNVNGG